MSKKLAIRGHSARGKEVIELLEMMGGKNIHKHDGGSNSYSYYLFDHAILHDRLSIAEDDDFEIFTLEKFLEKYPFKVNDRVIDVADGCPGIVSEMKWDEDVSDMKYCVVFGNGIDFGWFTNDSIEFRKEIKPLFKPGDVVKLKGCPDKNIFWIVMDVVKDGYIFNDGIKYSFDDQHHYEKTNREVINTQPSKMKNVIAELFEHIKTTPKEDLEREVEEFMEWSNVGPTVEEFMAFCESVNKKPFYPKTYEECCDILSIIPYYNLRYYTYEHGFHELATSDELRSLQDILNTFGKLLICCKAYWKIAGEQMGLGKPWEPDWSSFSEGSYPTITKCNGRIVKTSIYTHDCLLAFPTEEMRDAFYENFKNEIEQCKELL